jgi:DNA-directed RNA polymerase specialized sigma24 family protein
VPDDVPDDEKVFLARFGLPFAQGICYLRKQVNGRVPADDAPDLVHDFVAERLLPWLRRELPEPIDDPKAYLSASLKNYRRDFLRSRGRWPIPTPEDIGGNCDGPESTALRAWFWDTVDNQLCLGYRELIQLRLDRETCDVLRTWEEVAAELGITRDTASRRFREGMNAIRRTLDDE